VCPAVHSCKFRLCLNNSLVSVIFIHIMSPICVCLYLSPPISLCFTSLCQCIIIQSMSYTCFHINSSYQLTELCRHACQSACSSTWLSIRLLCIVAHFSVLLSSFTFLHIITILTYGWSMLLSFRLYSHNIDIC